MKRNFSTKVSNSNSRLGLVCVRERGGAEGADTAFREALPSCFTCLASWKGARYIESMFKTSLSFSREPTIIYGRHRQKYKRDQNRKFEFRGGSCFVPVSFLERATFSHCTPSIGIWCSDSTPESTSILFERDLRRILGMTFCFLSAKYPM
jgi:hypothetical protein